MAPQQGGRRKDEDDFDPPESIGDDDDLYPPSTVLTYTDISMETLAPTITDFPAEMTTEWPAWWSNKHTITRYPSFWPSKAESSEEAAASRTSYSVSKPTPLQDGSPTLSLSIPTLVVSTKAPSTTTADDSGSRRPDWTFQQKHHNNTPMYAAAAVVPVVLLAIIGAVVFLCLRKRKRQRQEADAAQMATHEMKKQPQNTVQPYMAQSRPLAPLQYTAPPSQLPPTSTPYQLQPVILGPIPSGSNGAYLTGMDTSDMVSITSNHLRPVDPFADNSSLAEPPPPPYRPASAAPPSFTTTSRQSSFRSSAPPPATSRTHLIERSPFDDPRDDDTVSVLSGPTLRRSEDAMSAVSDLSYQYDPFADRRRYDR